MKRNATHPQAPGATSRARAHLLRRATVPRAAAPTQAIEQERATGGGQATRGLLALKEWGLTCAALGCGEQTVLLRKGGIREVAFVPRAASFLLFPTSFHTLGKLLKPGVPERYAQDLSFDPKAQPELTIRYLATATGAWTTPEPSVLTATDALHVWGPAFLEARLKWRQSQPITLLELRCYCLTRPLQVPVRDELFGCFSWVDLAQGDSGSATAGVAASSVQQLLATPGALAPALSDEAFSERQAQLRSALKGVPRLQELHVT